MPKRAFKIYQRKRVININVNIFAAGLLSIALTKFPIHWISIWIGEDKKFLISVIAYVLDTLMDMLVYYGLHWIANHWNPHGHHPEMEQKAKYKKFAREATRVQAERVALVPIFMLIAMGGMWGLQKFADIRASWSFVIAFIAAMIVTRIIHTIWGLRTGTFKDNHPNDGSDLCGECQCAELEQEQEAEESKETDEVTL